MKIVKRCCIQVALILFFAAGLSSCKKPEPILIGYIGGLTTRTADLGIGGRNGAKLAVELRNQVGGINGRPIRLVVVDDGQDPDTARKAMSHLLEHKVEAIVGPMTSQMGLAVVPLANEARVLMVSPSVSTHLLKGKDDFFFRVIGTADEYGKFNARYHAQNLGMRRVVVFYDLGNKGYTESWLRAYVSEFEKHGGKVVMEKSYFSGNGVHFNTLIKELPKLRPDGVVVIGNAVDAAMVSQRVRIQNPRIQITACEWAGTRRFIEVGGRASEDSVVTQYANRDGKSPSYLAFRKAYEERHSDGNYNYATLSFDAANVILDALERKTAGQTLKQAVQAKKEYNGVQSKIVFDRYGDTKQKTYFSRVINGKFVTQEQ